MGTHQAKRREEERGGMDRMNESLLKNAKSLIKSGRKKAFQSNYLIWLAMYAIFDGDGELAVTWLITMLVYLRWEL